MRWYEDTELVDISFMLAQDSYNALVIAKNALFDKTAEPFGKGFSPNRVTVQKVLADA